MSGGVMAAAGLLATLAVCESVVPRFYAEWRHRRRKVREDQERADEAAARVAPEKPREAPAAPASAARPSDLPPPRCEDAPPVVEGVSEADRLWTEARRMPHNIIPDPATDGDYLAKIRGAAALGHLKAMAKLGEYAFRRGALVEAYYWTALAELKGASLLAETLRLIEAQWMQAGCPTEYDNLYDDFSERQGSFARALLRIRCGVDVRAACARLEKLAASGQEEARRFCLSSPGCALRCTVVM